jgi:hypothetical protein
MAGCVAAVAQESDKASRDEPLEAPKPKFEPTPKFEEDLPPAVTSPVDLPAPGPRLDHGCVGPRGTFHLCGWQGEASFLWPLGGTQPRFYREGMIYSHTEPQGLVYRLTGRFYRVWFRVAQKTGASGRHTIWIRNGDKEWAVYQLAAVASHAR